MQHSFLATYQAIKRSELTHINGLWLLHGDDALVINWLIDVARPVFQNHAQLIKRMELTSPKAWHEVIAELQSQSLFGDTSAIIATGKQRLDDNSLQALAHFAEDVKAGMSEHALIWLLPKQDKKSQATKAYRLFAEHGNVIDCQLYDERMRSELLHLKAGEFGITLDKDAWQMLLSHTEGNLLAAYQALWRLSDLYTDTPITPAELMEGLVSDSTYNVFNLSDALIQGNISQCLKILHELKRLDTAPSLVLWTFAKDIRILQAMQAGKDPASLGVWRNKTGEYQRAVRRTNSTQLQALSHLLYDTDKNIKGLGSGLAWRNFQDMALMLC